MRFWWVAATPPARPELLGFLAIEFVKAPTCHCRIEHFQGAAAGVDLVVVGEIGEHPSRTRNRFSFQRPGTIFTLPTRHCELNGESLASAGCVTLQASAARVKFSVFDRARK